MSAATVVKAGMISLVTISVLAASGCGQPALDHRTSGDPRAGRAAFRFGGCAACHAVSGIAVGETGPGLDGEGSRRAAPWLRRMLPDHVKKVGAAPIPGRDVEDLVAYLVSLR